MHRNPLEIDPLASQMDEVLERMSHISPVSSHKETFLMKLPGFEWENFGNSKGVALWRQLKTSAGRLVEFKVKAPFDFGRHSHPWKEIFRVEKGACLFGVGDMTFMEAGDSLTMEAGTIHSLRVLKAGIAMVYWPELDIDSIEITAE